MTRGEWGKTKAYFDFEIIEGCTIKGCRLILGDGFFVGMPSKLGKDENGEDKWKDIVYCDKELKAKITELAIDFYQNESDAPSPQPLPKEPNAFDEYIP